MSRPWRTIGSVLALAAGLLTPDAVAQPHPRLFETLEEGHFKRGTATRKAFAPLIEQLRRSIVEIRVDGESVALGTCVEDGGWIVTKASEISKGKLTCSPADRDAQAEAALIAVDSENDLALVRSDLSGLSPVQWTALDPEVGQWVVTPGLDEVEAVGIVSAAGRSIARKRALIGVQLDPESETARILEVIEGLGAEKAGLKPGDLVVEVDGRSIAGGDDLIEMLRRYRGGQVVNLKVQRMEEEFDAQVEMMVPEPEQLFGRLDRQERMNRLGARPSRRADGFRMVIQHDSDLRPDQCGGPLVNLRGEAIGINIARAGRIASYALPAELVREILTQLKRESPPTETRSNEIESSKP